MGTKAANGHLQLQETAHVNQQSGGITFHFGRANEMIVSFTR
jgi:hypothetical protein